MPPYFRHVFFPPQCQLGDMPQRSVHLVLVALVVLAGCSFPAQSGDREPSVTPAPVPGVDERGVEESEVALPGVFGGEVLSAVELSRAHSGALANRTYRVRESLHWTSTGAETRDIDATVTARTWYRDRTAVRHERRRQRVVTGMGTDSQWTNTSTFRLGDDRLVRTVQNGSVAFERVPADATSGRLRDNTTVTVRQMLAVRNATIESIDWRGEEHALLVGRDPRHGVFSVVDDYRVRAIIRPDGLVRRLSVSYSQSALGRQRTTEYTVAIDPVAPDRIERPDWVETAVNRTAPAP